MTHQRPLTGRDAAGAGALLLSVNALCAGAGALIGAIAGGGTGAAIGAGAGAAAGTGVAAATGKREVEIPAETVFTFRLKEPVEL